MSAGIVGFGATIPWLTDLYGSLRPGDAMWWAGWAGFTLLAAAIWLGNRWLLFEQRKHFGWFANPLRKLVMLVSANVLYTAPITAASSCRSRSCSTRSTTGCTGRSTPGRGGGPCTPCTTASAR